jgi:putative hydrolase of the HAD superfamily
MKKIINKHTVVVFDLDDTLYYEYDYMISGLRAVAKEIKIIYGADILSELLIWNKKKEKDIFGIACKYLNIPDSIKDSLIWIYRLHDPDIVLDINTKKTINLIKENAKQVFILTDGRSVTQRKKIIALGLNNIKTYISEEYKSNKPDLERYKIIMNEYPAERYLYIGDNPEKDFQGTKELGWTSVGLIAKKNNIHLQNNALNDEKSPDIWIKDIFDLIGWIE